MGMAAGAGAEERVLLRHLAQDTGAASPAESSWMPMPTGKIGDITLSRLISGGNIIAGFAHSRDLIYVSRLFKAYNTDERILETLTLCERYGINSIITNPGSGDIINRYWNERGGKIQWISQLQPERGEFKQVVDLAVKNGARMAFVQGVAGDRLYAQGRMDVVADMVSYIRDKGLPAGVGAHCLNVIRACEDMQINPDFYVKTLHTDDYWSARRPDQSLEVIRNPHDNFWCVNPAETIEFMKAVEKPWIAFKILAAGAIHPRSAFPHAFQNGADFICVGMFDFQIADNADLAIDTLAAITARERPWRA